MARKRRTPSKKAALAKKTKQQRIIAIVAIAIAIIAVFIATQSGGSGAPAEINTATAYEKFDDGAFMLDVRTPEEWVEYHVNGATLIPLDELEARINEVPADQEVIIICNSGNRAKVGRDILLAAGHTSVSSISGGIQGWMKAGYPTTSGE
ncbi:MAG: hypothetical protein B6243_05720 [Anaerolineaceae bacterium 4572_5.2]|nr:MAG: hypothetical protein B6243_05720 [Anaerolineaceae bacterium 4572_5.2]